MVAEAIFKVQRTMTRATAVHSLAVVMATVGRYDLWTVKQKDLSWNCQRAAEVPIIPRE